MKTVIVTGGRGFIGTTLCALLHSAGYNVVSLDAGTYAALPGKYACGGVTQVHGDIRDGGLVGQLLDTYQPHSVLNLAAESHVDRSIADPSSFISTNVDGTYELLEQIRLWLARYGPSGFKLVHVSTDEVFGESHGQRFTEDSPYHPSSPYSASKAAADHLVRAWGRTYGIPYCITHGANTFGPLQLPDKLIPMIIYNGLRQLPITIHGSGEHVRSWIHVTDHASAIMAVMQRGHVGESYCVENGVERSNLSMARHICSLLDDMRFECPAHSKLIAHVENRPGNDRAYCMTSDKLRAHTGWKPSGDYTGKMRQVIEHHIMEMNNERA